MKKTFFLGFLLAFSIIVKSQTINSHNLLNPSLKLHNIFEITVPEELLFIDTLTALKLAYREIEEFKEKPTGQSVEIITDYPRHACTLSYLIKDNDLETLLLNYFKKIPRTYIHNSDTFAVRFVYGLEEDLLSSLILQNSPIFARQLVINYKLFENISNRLKSKYSDKIKKRFLISGKNQTIRSAYNNANYLAIMYASVLNFINPDHFSNKSLDSLKSINNSNYVFTLAKNHDYPIEIKIDSLRKFNTYLKQNALFPIERIELSKTYDKIEDFLKEDININEQIFKKSAGDHYDWLVKYHQIKRPIVINHDMALFWHFGGGSEDLYRITRIDKNIITIQLITGWIH